MHVLAFVNQKGGCGKTTTAVNLAGALAQAGERTLLVDLDPQAHATLALSVAIEREPSLIDVLCDRVTLSETIVAVGGGFFLVPATVELAEFEAVAARDVQPEQVLRRDLAQCALSYDFVLLDCPPRADGVLTANALRAADTAVLVIETGTFALQGALKALDVLEATAATLDRPFALRGVATLFDTRLRIAREILVGMQAQLGPILFDTVIRSSVRLREAAAAAVPVQVLDRTSRAAADFDGLANEVIEHARATPRQLWMERGVTPRGANKARERRDVARAPRSGTDARPVPH